MEGFILSEEEIQELHAARLSAKSCKDVNAAYRIHAIILLGSGMTSNEVSNVLFINIDTLGTYVKKYVNGGVNKLCQNNYLGRQQLLDDKKLALLIIELGSRIYLTTKEVQDYISSTFYITYSISGINALLTRLGFVYKKPKLVPSNPDIDAQELFLKFYEEFMQNKKAEEKVFFVDAVHPQHNSMPAYGWMLKGTETELKSNSGRSRLNIHGAMDAETYETTILYSEATVDGDSTIDLMKSLEKIYYFAPVIYMILDNARYHYSKVVKEYEANSRVKLVYLPSYSPELNLIERLWKVLKKNVLYNKFYEKYDDFKKACIGFFVNQDQHMDEIKSIMGDGLSSLVA
jgi:transposase